MFPSGAFWSKIQSAGTGWSVPSDTAFHLWRCNRARLHYGINTSAHVKTSLLASGTNADLEEMSLASRQRPERTCTQAHLLHTGKELTLLAAPPTASPKLESSNIYGPAPPRLGCRLHACAVVNLWQFSAPFTCVTYASVSRLWAAEKTGTFHNLAKRGGASCLGVFLGSSSCYKWAHFLCVTDPLSSDEFMHF